jgi:hypothetical protein
VPVTAKKRRNFQLIQHGLTVEEAFGDWQGKVTWFEDPNTPTTAEWEDA